MQSWKLEGEKIRLGTVFSGCGAPEQSLKEMGVNFHTVFACDNDPYVKKTYLKNHDCDIFYDDIRSILNPPKTDIIIGGFPCQPHSIAGKRRGLLDDRGKLVFNFMRVIKESDPHIFIAENVEGLLTINGGKTIRHIIKKFEEMGYVVSVDTLNAIDYGIPQHRGRVWIVGSKIGKFNFSKPNIKCPPLADFLDKDVSGENVFATKSFLSKDKVIKRLSNYNNDYVNCITGTIARNGSSGEYINLVAAVNRAIGQKRKPTVSESCRLFGFPRDIFPKEICTTRRYKMLANSMVVPVVKSIINDVLKVY